MIFMLDWNADSVIELFLESAEIARRIKTNPRIEIKDDRTPVSDADREIEALLNRKLGAENLLGEETFQKRDHGGLIRQPFWGISIGYAENGTITRGAGNGS